MNQCCKSTVIDSVLCELGWDNAMRAAVTALRLEKETAKAQLNMVCVEISDLLDIRDNTNRVQTAHLHSLYKKKLKLEERVAKMDKLLDTNAMELDAAVMREAANG